MNAESEIFLTSTSVIRAVGNNTNQTNNNYITIGSTQINGSGINQTNNNAKPNQLTEGNLGGGGCSGLGNCDPNLNDQIIALPIELKTFTGHLNNGTTQLNWTTAKEENFSHFELERSVDQQKFEMIGIIQGRGESFSDLYYDFEDSDVPYGKIYYRLKAVDIDDTFEYSPVISVENSFKGKLSVYPNPVQQNEEMKIKVPGKFIENISYMALYDIQGSLIQEFIDFDPVNNLKVNTKIKSGLYLLKVQHNGLEENIRVYLK
ncbi:hypothetical protein GCM10011506_39260 [Marivirga lumbricoides]|uniref:Secretion system C-terminal sorting domain-containing protein n=1 Tax=Marivirga lumbricoides TaxID=1046115 RepID=A0ABQ1N0D4_9BACT|nr:hypothetical protein GCM10011506_39260 [Marivirga lumbricoides]